MAAVRAEDDDDQPPLKKNKLSRNNFYDLADDDDLPPLKNNMYDLGDSDFGENDGDDFGVSDLGDD